MKTVIAIAVAIVLAVVIGAGGFFAGTAYGQSQANNTRSEFFRNRGGGAAGTAGQGGQAGQNGQGGQNGQFGRPAAFGTVKSVNGNTVVISQQDGSTVTVTTTAQTVVQKTVSGTVSDITPGDRVTVESTQTGSNVVASAIQIRPASQ